MPYEYVKDENLEENIADAEQLKYDFQKNDKKIFDTNFMICVQADTYDELVENVNRVIELASENLIKVDPLHWRQLEGLMHILPIGHNSLTIQRSLTSEAAAVNVPFNTKDLMHKNALFYGMNQVSKNGIFADRRLLLNGNGCVLATSGAGKSFTVKMLISQIFLKYQKDNIIILDLNGEYSPIVDEFKGQTVKISANSNTKINPLDYDASLNFDDRGALSNKIEYMIAFCESVAGDASGTLKSIIDRCVRLVLLNTKILNPKLIDFYTCLQEQPESEANTLATVLERYVLGSVNTFAHDTNVDLHNRLVNFDLSELEESMRKTGYLVVLEHIMQTIARNKARGVDTHIFIDEFHILLETEYTASYIAKIYKTIRKFFGFPTIITQNIEEVLSNKHGRKILGNSEFAVILKQNATDLKLISSIFNISEKEEEYITASNSGEGLIYYGGNIIPFRNTVSKDTALYRMCETSERVAS
ncbi:MAG: VirB4-like conjugal transfer ATPase, CD1110 family [Coprobacillaceae bacterium]